MGINQFMKHPFLKTASSGILLSASVAIVACSQLPQENEETKRPNVLFIFADDQRADALGCAGNSYIHTPNIDQIATSGVRFTNSYVMGGHHGAICAPSRAMLMSGKSLFHVYRITSYNVCYTKLLR